LVDHVYGRKIKTEILSRFRENYIQQYIRANQQCVDEFKYMFHRWMRKCSKIQHIWLRRHDVSFVLSSVGCRNERLLCWKDFSGPTSHTCFSGCWWKNSPWGNNGVHHWGEHGSLGVMDNSRMVVNPSPVP
jgi:hypothetical protein